MPETKMCSKCKRELLLSQFTKNKVSKDGLDYLCKECKSAKQKEQREKTKSKIKIYDENATKICSMCKRELSVSEFNKCNSFSDGLSYICKECSKIKQKQWYENNKDKERTYIQVKSKICSKCNRELPATSEYFNKEKNSNDGLQQWCRECQKEAKKEWDKNNKEHVKEYRKRNLERHREYSRQWYHNNLEKARKYHREYNSNPRRIEKRKQWYKNHPNYNKIYYEEHKDELKEKNKQWYYNNLDIIRYKSKIYYNNNADKIRLRTRIWAKENPEKVRINNQKRESLKKELPAELTVEQWEVIKKAFDHCCAYCGEKIDLTQDHFIPLSKSGEYTLNNIVPACKSCNCSKNDFDFFEWYPRQSFYSEERKNKILEFLGYDEEEKVQQLALII